MKILTNLSIRKYLERRVRGIFSLSMVLILMVFSTGIAQAFSESDVQSIHNGTEFYDPAAAGQTSTSCTTTAGGCTCSTVTLTGSSDLEQEWNFFIAQGLTTSQTAGIIGNMRAESYFNPEQLENTAQGVNTPYTQLTTAQINDTNLGWGIVQWTPSSKFIDPTLAANGDPDDLATQLSYLWTELTGHDAGVLANIKLTTTPQAAADVFLSQFEIPYDIAGNEPGREAYAEAYYQYFVNNVPLPPALQSSTTAGSGDCTTPTSPNGPTGPGTPSTGYRNPLRSVLGLVPQRIDQGVDYDGTGPVYAIGDATVINVRTTGSGWPGLNTACDQTSPCNGTFINYKLTDGPAAGDYVYFAEDCTPSVSIGDTINSSTVICTMVTEPNPSGIETGWTTGSLDDIAIGASQYDANGRNNYATSAGQNFSALLKSLGAPPGLIQGNAGPDTLAGYPNWQ